MTTLEKNMHDFVTQNVCSVTEKQNNGWHILLPFRVSCYHCFKTAYGTSIFFSFCLFKTPWPSIYFVKNMVLNICKEWIWTYAKRKNQEQQQQKHQQHYIHTMTHKYTDNSYASCLADMKDNRTILNFMYASNHSWQRQCWMLAKNSWLLETMQCILQNGGGGAGGITISITKL